MSTASKYIQLEVEKCAEFICESTDERMTAPVRDVGGQNQILQYFWTVYGRRDGSNDLNGHQLLEAIENFATPLGAMSYAMQLSGNYDIPVVREILE